MGDQDKLNPVECELIVRQLDMSAFTDPETGEITDSEQTLNWVNERLDDLPRVRARFEIALEDVEEAHQGEYLQFLVMICHAQKDWPAVERHATRAEALHKKLGDPARAARGVVQRVEAWNGQGDYSDALRELELVLDYLADVAELAEGSDERGAAEAVLPEVRNGYAEVQRVSLLGLYREGDQERVTDYCERLLEKPAFKEEEATLLLVTADTQNETKQFVEAMATLRRLEAVAVEIERFDIATNAALGQAVCSLQEFKGISAPGDFHRAAGYLQRYSEDPNRSQSRFKAEVRNFEQVHAVLARKGLLSPGLVFPPGVDLRRNPG
ncbi:MAG TPA: hypothetical protein VIF43_00470 [Patescibacteria group bacterium]|jgi:tetratricopeptide (TPR) repeat protein